MRHETTASAERAHHDHGDVELRRKWQQLALALALVRVVGNLQRLELARPERLGECGLHCLVVVRDAELADASIRLLALEPLQLLAPEHEVVDLVDLDVAAVPLELMRELLLPFVDGARPDLRRERRLTPPVAERRSERPLGTAVHRRRVEDLRARVERRSDDLTSKRRVGVEGVPGAESDDRPESPLLHYAPRAASTSASVTSTIDSRSATVIRSSFVWMSVM